MNNGTFVALPSARLGRVSEVTSEGTAIIISGYDIGHLGVDGTLVFCGKTYVGWVLEVL